MKKISLLTTALLLICSSLWAKPVVNVYVWGGEIPDEVIKKFENTTGINVNYSTYDNNETMYAKIKASQAPVYDVIMPSAYYVERMQKQDLLTKLDKSKIPNYVNIEKTFVDNDYDRGNNFSMPLVWGATGIFYNQKWIPNTPVSWHALWDNKLKNQLLLLDDPREIFSIGLMKVGYNPNDSDPKHIEQAYQALLELVPNIKLFASENLQSILIDEDALLGIAWNGDVFKTREENPHVYFVYPKEGFVIWVDCLAIPKNAPHLEQAYKFINFMLQPQVAKQIAEKSGYAITNTKGIELLPDRIRKDTIIYPDKETLERGHFQRDVPIETLNLYNKYWEQLKLSM